MVLESPRSARLRGVTPLARVEGTAVRFVQAKPNQGATQAIALAIRGALDLSGRSADQIGAVVSQASGHSPYDRSEAEAVQSVLGPEKLFFTPIGSLGHCGAASGSLALAIGTLIAHHRVIPPSLNWDKADPSLGLRLLAQPEAIHGDSILVLSHTGQGHACASILGAPSGEI